MLLNDNCLEMDFLRIPDNTKYWFVRAGSKAEFFQDFNYNNYIAIGDNEIKLTKLKAIDNKYLVTDGAIRQQYKNIFNEKYISLFEKSTRYNSMSKSEQADEIEKIKRSSTIAANKTALFIENMSIGDYILVPYKRSELFLLGIVISDVFDAPIDHTYFGNDSEYSICDYEKKRRIIWLKEISLSELPESLYWIQTGHKAIFDITKNADDINPIISSQYIYKDLLNLRVNVGTQKKVNSRTWLNYQSLINNSVGEQAENLYQKNKVQSPGHTVLQVVIENWEPIAIVGAALFFEPDIEVKGFKFKWHGPLSFLVPGSKKRKERSERMADIELELKEEELKEKKITNGINELEWEKQKKAVQEIIGKDTLLETSEVSKGVKDNLYVPTSDEQEAIQQMKISQKSLGSVVPLERQTDILNLVNSQPSKGIKRE